MAILELQGFLVEVAKDGIEGLEKIKQNRYDVIISDYLMPGINGEELYHKIRTIKQDLEKRIIFISGITNEFLTSHGNMFLPKPFTVKELIEAVKKLTP
jgi:two-component system chemotaxis response regulator CheY